MDSLDLEGPAHNRPSLSERLSALWTSITSRQQQRFERLAQDDAPDVEKIMQAAGKTSGLRWCPEEDANFFSMLVFNFVSGLIRIGYQKPLLQNDLWDVCRCDEANTICGRFHEILEGTKWRRTTPKGSVFMAMWRTHARVFIMVGFIKLFDNILTFISPLLLERLLLSLQSGASAGEPLMYALAMFLVGVTETLVNNRQMHYSMRMVMQLKSQMIGMLYDKSLRLHSAARAVFGTGAIVNLQSNDAHKLWWLPLFMHILWSAPLQILVVCALLVRVMGIWPAAAGLFVTLLLIPTSSFVGRRLAAARRAVVGQTDARVKLTTEVVLGIRAIKLYSWEEPFVKRIMGLRDKELSSIRLAAIYNALNTMLFLGGPMFISLAAFTVYGALGYQLTAAVAFPALALFNLLRFPLMMLPEQILNVIQGRVALTRVQNFMDAEEMEQAALQPAAAPGELAVVVRGGEFAWETGAPSILRDINLQATAGQLVIVVGEVGSGKSSLLSALLGEMIARGGCQVTVSGTVGYTSQDPWIVNSTLRDNITMGTPFDQEHYDRTLAACALGQDIAGLAGGDAAEIGEKGINLSGGQRARVSLARACYAGADTYLLDDPLSAVDAHVGQHLFQECICGALASSTRILVTHQLQFLPSADLILVLAGGRIANAGTYSALTAAGVEFRHFAIEGESDSEGEGSEDGCSLPVVAEALAGDLMAQLPAHTGHEPPVLGEALGAPSQAFEAEVAEMSEADQERVRGSSQASSSGGDENRPPVSASNAGRKGEAPALLKQSANSMDLGGPLVRTSFASAAFNGQREEDTIGTDPQCRGTAQVQGSSFGSAAAQMPPIMERTASSGSARRKSKDLATAGFRRLSRERSRGLGRAGSKGLAEGSETQKGPAFGKLVEKEERATGHVEFKMYKVYLRSWSTVGFTLPIVMMVIATGERLLAVGQNFWLSIWTDSTVAAKVHHSRLDNRSYIAWYLVLGSVSIMLQAARLLLLVKGSITATQQLHANLLEKVVRLPLSFFSSQPTGRLLNRFARDTEAVDTKVPNALNSFLNCLVNVVGSLAINLLVTPLVCVPLVPMAYLYDLIRRRFVTTSREVKRLDSLAMSPIFGQFSETLQGLVSVRAFRLQEGFHARHNALLDASTRCWWPLMSVNRWLSIRLEFLGTTLVLCTAVAATVLLPRSAGLAGLAITAALNLTGLMNWTVRQSTELEVQMNSVERILAYTTAYEAEKPAIIPHKRPPADWPSQGQITLDNLVVKYRPDLPPVLKGLSLSIKAGEKIGVAGRTGGGKSTLMMALFRIIEPASGTIYIDGLDITDMGLHDLRSRLALVPQDPVVFSGSVRANLDPFDSVDGDAPIWQALERAGLKSTIAGLPGGLDADIAEGGGNLSTGQRQLLCMARALLRQARILVLDEATSSIDNQTDTLIQSMVRSAFAGCTVLTVAHRLHTIADCDRILVLDAGSVREFEAPGKLLKDPSSAFYGLVAETTRQQSKLTGSAH